MSRGRRHRLLAVMPPLVALALLGAAVPSIAAATNVTGTWASVYHCQGGWCAGRDFPDRITLEQAPGSSAVTGTDQLGAVITGRLAGDRLTLHYADGSYLVEYSLTVSPDGTSWSGAAHDSASTLGEDFAVRSSTATTGLTASPTGPAAPSDIGKNADFIGTWGSSPSGWRILTQAPDGSCTGTSDFGYAMSGCRVTGDRYVFTLTTGGYTSHDSGTIAGNEIHGSFSDSNGTHEAYTATRSPAAPGATSGTGTGAPVTPGPTGASGTTPPPSRDQSSIAASLATPSDAFGSPGHDAAVLAIAGAGTLLVVFPAQLFNHTLEENYDEITGIVERRLRRWYRAVESAGKRLGERRDRVRVALVVLVGAYLGGLLDPAFGLSWRSLETYVGMTLATVTSVVLGAVVASRYRRHRAKGRTVVLRALPLGLLVGAGCMLVSRLASFEPGYLYGVVAGVGFAEELTDREEAHVATLSVVASLAAATLSWLLWDLVNRPATHAGFDVPLVVLDDLLAAVFAGGLTGAVISLLPLRFLPGGRIASWHKGAWAAVFTLALFGLVGVLLWPNRDRHSGSAPIVTVVILFVVFGGISLGFWRYFELRKKKKEQAAEGAEPHEAAQVDAAALGEPAQVGAPAQVPLESTTTENREGGEGQPGSGEPAPVADGVGAIGADPSGVERVGDPGSDPG